MRRGRRRRLDRLGKDPSFNLPETTFERQQWRLRNRFRLGPPPFQAPQCCLCPYDRMMISHKRQFRERSLWVSVDFLTGSFCAKRTNEPSASFGVFSVCLSLDPSSQNWRETREPPKILFLFRGTTRSAHQLPAILVALQWHDELRVSRI